MTESNATLCPARRSDSPVPPALRARSLPDVFSHEIGDESAVSNLAHDLPRPLHPDKFQDIKNWAANITRQKAPMKDLILSIEEYLGRLSFKKRDLASSISTFHGPDLVVFSEPQLDRLNDDIVEMASRPNAVNGHGATDVRTDVERLWSKFETCRWWMKCAEVTVMHIRILDTLSTTHTVVAREGLQVSTRTIPNTMARWVERKSLEAELAMAQSRCAVNTAQLIEQFAAILSKFWAFTENKGPPS